MLEPRLREIRLRRQPFAVAKLVDVVGALRLLRHAPARGERRFRRPQLNERHAGVERGELLRLLQSRARLVEIRLRDLDLTRDATAAEQRHADLAAYRPVLG